MYQFTDEFDYEHFFFFDKALIGNGNWALLPDSSKAVLPVISDHADEKGESWPSEQRVAILSGISDKSVRLGISGLESFPGFSYESYTTRRGRTSKKFHLQLPRNPKPGTAFPFYRFTLEAGCWCEATPSAKALYPVMRYYAYFDPDEYAEREDIEYTPSEFEEFYKHRMYDTCEAEYRLLMDAAALKRRSFFNALQDLQRCHLIEPLGEGRFKVFLRTEGVLSNGEPEYRFFRRAFLNRKIREAYGHLF